MKQCSGLSLRVASAIKDFLVAAQSSIQTPIGLHLRFHEPNQWQAPQSCASGPIGRHAQRQEGQASLECSGRVGWNAFRYGYHSGDAAPLTLDSHATEVSFGRIPMHLDLHVDSLQRE